MLKRTDKEITGKALPLILIVLCFLIITFLCRCSGKMPASSDAEHEVIISPDYTGITIPPNIAPLMNILAHLIG